MSFKKITIGLAVAALALIAVGVYVSRQTSGSAAREKTEKADQLRNEKENSLSSSREEKKARSAERMEKSIALRKALKHSLTNESGQESDGPVVDSQEAKFDSIQTDALIAAFESFYDAAELKRALEDGNVVEYMRESSRKLDELEKAETIKINNSEIPITDDMRVALARMRLLNSYAANISHSMRSDGDLEAQNRNVLRINRGFRQRFETLNQNYPFLNAEMIQP